MLQIGDICIHLINDGNTLGDGGGPFGLVPRKLWQHVMNPDDENQVLMTLTCLLVQVAGRSIVIDTGLGNKLTEREIARWNLTRPNGGLVEGLARLGLTPGDIDLVIDTHLHADHCAGNTAYSPDGKIVPVFPNAEYVVQRREYADASHPNERTRATYFAVNFEPLVESGQMRLLDGDTELAPGVRGMITRGHTPGHMSIRFESQGQQAAFLCDLSTFAVHIERIGWTTSYDIEPMETIETKRVWQRWALETNAVLMFPHDPYRRAGRLTQDAQGVLKLDPIDEPYV